MSHQLLETALPILVDPPDLELEIPDAPPVEERGRTHAQQEQHDTGPAGALDDRRTFQRRCEKLAASLASAGTFGERIEIYEGRTSRELSTASALCPDLMPLLNGEFEWIALQSPDVLD